MTDQQTPVLERPVQSQTPPAAPAGPRKKKRGSRVKLVVGLLIAAAVIGAVAFALWYFVFREDDARGKPMVEPVQLGSIQVNVEGSGTTKAKDSATITPNSGTVLELFVKEGDQVTAGQQLYRMTVNEGDPIAKLVNDTKLRMSLYYSYAYENSIHVGQTAQISIPSIMGSRTGTVEKINKVRFVSPEGATHFEVVFVLDNPGTLTEGMEASAGLTAADGTPIYPYENGKLEFYETTEIKAKASGPVESVNLLNYRDVKAGQTLVQLGAKNTDEEIASKENALKDAEEKLKTATEELAKYNAVAPIDGTVLSCTLMEGQEVSSGQGITIADTSVMTIEIQVDEMNVQYIKPGMMVNIDQYGTPYMGIVESVSLTATGENGVATFPAVVKVDNPDGSLMSGMYVNYSFVASQSDNCLTVPVQAVKYVSFSNVQLPDNLDADPNAGGGFGEGGMVDGSDPETGLPEDGFTEDGFVEDGMTDGVVALPQRYSGGVFGRKLGAIAVPMPDGGGMIDSSMGGSMGGSMEEETRTIVWVKSDEPPVNAILEPDPAWEGPEGFWAVPVEVGLNDSARVEIKRGLTEGQEVFVGYETPEQTMY